MYSGTKGPACVRSMDEYELSHGIPGSQDVVSPSIAACKLSITSCDRELMALMERQQQFLRELHFYTETRGMLQAQTNTLKSRNCFWLKQTK